MPSPAPSPRTGSFSMYTFWLMSSLLFLSMARPAAVIANAAANTLQSYIAVRIGAATGGCWPDCEVA
eukprot:UN2393